MTAPNSVFSGSYLFAGAPTGALPRRCRIVVAPRERPILMDFDAGRRRAPRRPWVLGDELGWWASPAISTVRSRSAAAAEFIGAGGELGRGETPVRWKQAQPAACRSCALRIRIGHFHLRFCWYANHLEVLGRNVSISITVLNAIPISPSMVGAGFTETGPSTAV